MTKYTYDDFLFISVLFSSFNIARMICAMILLTIISNVFMIFFVYFFVGATAAFVSSPFSHGYKGLCVF